MNRRGFLKGLTGAVAAIAAVPLVKLLPKAVGSAKLARGRGCSPAELEFWRNRKRPACTEHVAGFNFYDLRSPSMYLADPLLPPQHPNCRCVVAPIVVHEEEFIARYTYSVNPERLKRISGRFVFTGPWGSCNG